MKQLRTTDGIDGVLARSRPEDGIEGATIVHKGCHPLFKLAPFRISHMTRPHADGHAKVLLVTVHSDVNMKQPSCVRSEDPKVKPKRKKRKVKVKGDA